MKIFLMIVLCVVLSACTPKKPPLTSTQVVNGKSIIVPPEFDIKP